MSTNFDLNEKINLIYNFTYNNDFPTCYKIDKVDHKNIIIDDIKFTENKKKSINDITTELFKGQFKLLNYDKKNNITILKKFSDTFPLTLYIEPYKKDTDSMNIKKNKDSYLSYVLSNIVLNKLTKHILLPIVNLDIRFQQISDILKNQSSFKNYVEGIEQNKHSDLFSIRVKEHFFNSIPLDSFLKENKCEMKN